MKNRKPGLLTRLAIAIVLGIVAGLFLPACGIRALNSFRDLFGQFIKYLVPFIILGFVTPAIADTGRTAGRMLLLTMGLAWGSTIFAGTFAYVASCTVDPWLLRGANLANATQALSFPAYFSLKIPPILDVVTALVTAFMLGLGIAALKADALYLAFGQLKAIVERTIAKAFVPLLPVYIFTVIADLTASGRLKVIAGPAVKLMVFCTLLTVVVLFAQYTLAGLVSRKNPLRALVNMLPAYLTGWGCCSSAATIPVTLRQTKLNGVSEETANLVIPLCSNVHLAGSMSNMVAYAAGLMVMWGEPLAPTAFAEFIFMMSIIAVASPGVPGGCVLAAATLVETALGFTPERYALMVAIYLALDGMGTACNLTGDGAIALVVDRLRPRPHRPSH